LRSFTTHRTGPFEDLDRDWALLCMQHRRSWRVREWALQEPALCHVHRLEDVIPADMQDRTATFRAVMRLHVAGDELAGRTLLQLLVPGLVQLTARWREALGGVTNAGHEIIGRAAISIAGLRTRNVRCSPAGYVLRSVERDLRDDLKRQASEPLPLDADEVEVSRSLDPTEPDRAPSAEEVASRSSFICMTVAAAARHGYLTPVGAEIVLRSLHGQSLPAAARAVGTCTATAYRAFDAACAYVQRAVVDESSRTGAVA
jgi:hypothetical protein